MDARSLANGLRGEPVMRSYEPTWRDRMASALMGDSRPSPTRSSFVAGLMGSRGLGSTGPGVVDFTGAGSILQAQEAAKSGDNKGAMLALLPLPAARAVPRGGFTHWFNGSHVTDASGGPLTVYRGEHGAGVGNKFQTRNGSLSFGDRDTANLYAMEPNVDAQAVAPRVTPAYLQMRNPFMKETSDPYIELSLIRKNLGDQEARRIAHKYASHIENTSNWIEEINGQNKYTGVKDYLSQNPQGVDNLYFLAHPFFDNKYEVASMRRAGYDGAIHGGYGDNGGEAEYRVFHQDQYWPAIGNR